MSPTSGFSAKSRMVIRTLRLCNADADAQGREETDSKDAASTANGGKNNSLRSWSDVYVECLESRRRRLPATPRAAMVDVTELPYGRDVLQEHAITLVNDNLMTAIEATTATRTRRDTSTTERSITTSSCTTYTRFSRKTAIPYHRISPPGRGLRDVQGEIVFHGRYRLFDSYASKGRPGGRACAMTTARA